MKRYVYMASLAVLTLSLPAWAQPSAQCRQYVRDMMVIYGYGTMCVDDQQMTKVLNDKANEAAAMRLMQLGNEHCANVVDDTLTKTVYMDMIAQDPELKAIVEDKHEMSANFCQSRAATVQGILQRVK